MADSKQIEPFSIRLIAHIPMPGMRVHLHPTKQRGTLNLFSDNFNNKKNKNKKKTLTTLGETAVLPL